MFSTSYFKLFIILYKNSFKNSTFCNPAKKLNSKNLNSKRVFQIFKTPDIFSDFGFKRLKLNVF